MSSGACEEGKKGPRAVVVENRQEKRSVSESFMKELEEVGGIVLGLIHERSLALTEVPETVEVSLLDDVMIGEVHGQYMDDPSPTDVITFPYDGTGEILISVETADLQAKEFGMTWEREMTLYLVHGILHLCGYEDTDEEGRERMNVLQTSLLEEVLGGGRESK